MFIKERSIKDKPRERAKDMGFEKLTTIELIALIIRSGSKRESVLELSNNILKKTKNLSILKSSKISDLNSIYGMGDAKTISLLAALELANRFSVEEVDNKKYKITTPLLAFKYIRQFNFNSKQEEFYIICLNTRKEVLGSKMIFKGTVDSAIVHPREIFQYIIEMCSSYAIIAHNHPSRNLIPSREDIEITRRLCECGEMLNIIILDHLIFSDLDYTSMKEQSLM
ncbi:MAG: RadC family protein [Bacilli bacterium]